MKKVQVGLIIFALSFLGLSAFSANAEVVSGGLMNQVMAGPNGDFMTAFNNSWNRMGHFMANDLFTPEIITRGSLNQVMAGPFLEFNIRNRAAQISNFAIMHQFRHFRWP